MEDGNDCSMAGKVLCLVSLVSCLLLCWELARERRKIMAENRGGSAEKRESPPCGVVGAMTYGVRNWRTVQNMLHWKAEVSNLDAVMMDLGLPEANQGSSPPRTERI